MNPFQIIQAVMMGIGLAEQLGPVFIHNPNSQQKVQKIEAVIFTDLNALLSGFQPTLLSAPAPAPTVPTTPPAQAAPPAVHGAIGNTATTAAIGPAGVYPPK